MKLLTEREQIRSVAAEWKRQYPDGSCDAVYKQLSGLDVETATADDVAAIIGNRSWVTEHECDQCGRRTWNIVMVGAEPDYESSTACMCAPCLRSALSLLRKKP